MPYLHDHDDIVQLVGSIQLFLTLFTGLILKLQWKTAKEMDELEKRNVGFLLIALNASIIISAIVSLIFSTEYGKKCWSHKKWKQEKNRNQGIIKEEKAIELVGKKKQFNDIAKKENNINKSENTTVTTSSYTTCE